MEFLTGNCPPLSGRPERLRRRNPWPPALSPDRSASGNTPPAASTSQAHVRDCLAMRPGWEEGSTLARVIFTANLKRHVDAPMADAPGATVREVLDGVFEHNTTLRGYVLDEQGGLRKHMGIIVDGIVLADRRRLSDSVRADSTVYVLQALSGG